MSDRVPFVAMAIVVFLCLLLAAHGRAQTNFLAGYDASQGLHPDKVTNSIFGIFRAGGPAVAYAQMSNGALHMVQQGYFGHFTGDFDFSSPSNVFVLAANLRVLSSDYTIFADGQRSGEYLEAYDSAGYGFELGISSGGVTLNTDAAGAIGQGIPLTPFNSTDGFHEYQVTIRNAQATLLIDGNPFGSAALISGEPLGPEIGFGNLGGAFGTESGVADLRNVSLTSAAAPVALPAPSPGLFDLPVLDSSGQNWLLALNGSPGGAYAVDWTHSLTPPVIWVALFTNVAGPNGWVLFTNPPSGQPADFYRARPLP